jgi:uncharacterized membrane protein YdbT with pleckstrin-like domain
MKSFWQRNKKWLARFIIAFWIILTIAIIIYLWQLTLLVTGIVLLIVLGKWAQENC